MRALRDTFVCAVGGRGCGCGWWSCADHPSPPRTSAPGRDDEGAQLHAEQVALADDQVHHLCVTWCMGGRVLNGIAGGGDGHGAHRFDGEVREGDTGGRAQVTPPPRRGSSSKSEVRHRRYSLVHSCGTVPSCPVSSAGGHRCGRARTVHVHVHGRCAAQWIYIYIYIYTVKNNPSIPTIFYAGMGRLDSLV